MTVDELIAAVDAAADPADAVVLARYFKTGPGEYGEGDTFIGVKLSVLRGIVKPYVRAGLPLADLERALASPVHEHRLAVLVVLADRAVKYAADLEPVYELYLRNTAYVDNWDLVDCSAAEIVGGYLLDRDPAVLRKLVASSNMWERRIALVATHRFIRNGDSTDIYELAPLVLDDDQDLIHKAAGWMLREAGKRVDESELRAFLDEYADRMPRTMLRYAIERLPADVRQHYLKLRRR